MSKKFSDELKFTIVQDYLNGTLGYRSLATKHEISDKNLIRTWVNNYPLMSKENLKRKKKSKHTIPLEFNLNVLLFKQKNWGFVQ